MERHGHRHRKQFFTPRSTVTERSTNPQASHGQQATATEFKATINQMSESKTRTATARNNSNNQPNEGWSGNKTSNGMECHGWIFKEMAMGNGNGSGNSNSPWSPFYRLLPLFRST
jgi:hypothetical protein